MKLKKGLRNSTEQQKDTCDAYDIMIDWQKKEIDFRCQLALKK